MFTVYACLTEQHDYRLVILATVVCLFASITATNLLRRSSAVESRLRFDLTFAATITGIGVWATHFIAMLAFRPGVQVGYDLGLTLASLLVAVVLIGAGFALATRSRLPHAPLIGGGFVGLAIGAMHYLGMAAFRVQGMILWDAGLVATSLILGVGFAAAAMTVILKPREPSPLRHVVAAVLLTLSICSVHYIGMGAASVLPDSVVPLSSGDLPPKWLAIWVASGAVSLLMLNAVGGVMAKTRRRAESRRRRDLANTAIEGLVVCAGGRIVTANASFAALAARDEPSLVGIDFADLFEDPAVAERLSKACDPQGEPVHFETAMKSIGKDPIPVELIARMLPNDGRRQGVAVRDLRARNLADAQIRFLAHNDLLTGLANRGSFNDQLERELARHRRQDDTLAVLCMDLDRFKQINDVFGHAAGDIVLKVTAERIAAMLDENDVFARLGGDEFAVIRRGPCRPAELAALAEDILAGVTADIALEGGRGMVGISLGIALFPADGEDGDTLLRNADAALYRAKSDGRGAYRFFEPAIGAALRRRQGLEQDLRSAIARGEMKVIYQPQTVLKTGETFGFEALARWTHPVRGAVPPDTFIPLAEESGLILPIGQWVLRQACREAAQWSKPLQIAVNLSGVQLHAANLPRMVEEILVETGLEPGRLELEITETALILDFDHALAALQRIKNLGVKIATDDFGTGYSSLSNLRAFPFDKIKIDQSFIRDVHLNPEAATIVRAIFGLARGLNLKVLAEGVESPEELAFLGEELCAEAQGFLFGRPGDMSEFSAAFAVEPPESLIPARMKRLSSV